MPAWVTAGYTEYARRLPHECSLQLVEVPVSKRRKSLPAARAMQEEGQLMLAAIPAGCLVVALDVTGKTWSTEVLAERLQQWMAGGRDVALLVGGPDGLAPECLASSDMTWSLSALTYPHALVRIILAEQLYRAWSINAGHPYHRS
jgi:23S rRNA (pseudouridine1915-N3)-methyltransferase